MPIAYRTISGTKKLLYKDGHLCSTCCGPLGQIWLDRTLCGTHPRAGDATAFTADGLATPGYYWRVWDWAASAGNELCYLTWGCFYITGYQGPAQGTVTAEGRLDNIYDNAGGPPYIRPNLSEGLNVDRYVDIQISYNGTTWPTSP